MSNLSYYLVVLLLAAVLGWQLISGKALGTWWFSRITREDNPKLFWLAGGSSGRHPHRVSDDREKAGTFGSGSSTRSMTWSVQQASVEPGISIDVTASDR